MERSANLIGAILVRYFGVSLRSLQFALERQKETGDRVGGILVDMGVITQAQLMMALQHQAEMRAADEAARAASGADATTEKNSSTGFESPESTDPEVAPEDAPEEPPDATT